MASVGSSDTAVTLCRSKTIRLTTTLIFVLILEMALLSRYKKASPVTQLPFKKNIINIKGTKVVDVENVDNVDSSAGYIPNKSVHVHGAHKEYDTTPCVKHVQVMGSALHMKPPSGRFFCPAENCSLVFYHSMDYSKLKTMDAVILYHVGEWKWENLRRSVRPPRQMLIYFSIECAFLSEKLSSPMAFNWTMTFQTNADFVFPYGRYIPDSPEIREDLDRNWAENKTKLIAWMASNCGRTSWNRKGFVEKLNEMIPVDMYGKCGKLLCPPDERCDTVLSSYKFYLAFENSQCRDYITEKLWRNAYLRQAVPIVYGAPKEDYERLAPPHSFIHLDDFPNMSALVHYIKYLDKNDSAYNEYFAWKRHGSVQSVRLANMGSYQFWMSDLLHKLRDFDRRNPINGTWKPEIADMQQWKRESCGEQTMPFD